MMVLRLARYLDEYWGLLLAHRKALEKGGPAAEQKAFYWAMQ